ncbi:hypothetical protein RclHR1_13110003 [Rhizophagus clarus]|uniref:Uncharacterized protein n=1 Tax=Rhizophagus clarus TaxID=94130 RepID=A0A2Z6R1M4_9GLOM|nr:hypothetical protein RclHR1_13110003 [Rhizophagus clarus]
MLNDNEWKLMKQLTKILQPFYDATKLLGGKKYATASFMYYVVATLQIKVIPKEVEVVDLTNDDDDLMMMLNLKMMMMTMLLLCKTKKEKSRLKKSFKL